MYRTLHEARHQNRTHLGRPRRSDNMRVFGHTTSKRNGRLLLVQYWQHLINEHFQRGQSGKPSAIEHEIIDAQVDEAAHLFDHLLRRADKAKVTAMSISIPHLPHHYPQSASGTGSGRLKRRDTSYARR